MPNMNDNIENVSSVSAVELTWDEALDAYARERKKLETQIKNERLTFEAEIADYQENKYEYLKRLKEKDELAFLKKLFELEKSGLKLTLAEKDALRKKEQRDKEKADKEAIKKAKKDVSEGVGYELAELLKAGTMSAKEVFAGLGQLMKEDLKDSAKDFQKAFNTNLAKAGIDAVKDAMDTVSGVYSRINARLLASGENFKEINNTMLQLLAASPFIRYEDMLAKVDELVNSGVAYNVELRAFLASISDKIANTFDAFDSNLLRIIRIQQEDSTKLRLGMEARLLEFLNANYQDSSYLSGAHDSVTEALTASIVQLGTNRGAEYEYAVLKWFGSLSALGLSDSALTGLADAINAASTGDVESLNGSAYLNLIVMAANRAGISYGDILTQGLNSDSVNSLIQAIVTYWGTIATETNQIVRNQYGKLFGLDMIDLTAIKNITNKDLELISKESLSYSGMRRELSEQLGKVVTRLHPAEMLNNVWENFLMGTGLNIANSPVGAVTWLINDFIKDMTGGINIPSFGAFAMGNGFNFDIESDVNSLILLGMVGFSTLGLIGRVVSGLGGLGGLNLSMWGEDQYTRHGLGLSAPVTGVSASTSLTAFIGNSSSSDIYDQTLNKAREDAGYSEIKSQAQADADRAKEQMNNIESDVHQIMEYLRDVFTGSSLRVKVEDYGLINSFGV